MSYRYSLLDIVVGVGLCAILVGAMLIMFATAGTFVITPQPLALAAQGAGNLSPESWLQPALGQAIVERTILQRRSDQLTGAAVTEWQQAVQAARFAQVVQDDPFGVVSARAAMVPDNHAARVQMVMGRSIVNFTRRGVTTGRLSADQYLSDYNRDGIAAAEGQGQRLDREFQTTWQPLLGRWIVQAAQDRFSRVPAAQEQLGIAIVHRAQATTVLEEAWTANQYQVGSLLAAIDRDRLSLNQPMVAATADRLRNVPVAMAADSFSRPEVPVGYMILAAVLLCSIFWGGLVLSAASREAKALAEAKRYAGQWVYRLAA